MTPILTKKGRGRSDKVCIRGRWGGAGAGGEGVRKSVCGGGGGG